MFTPQKTSDGKATSYGMGWGSALEDGRRRIEHTSGSVGATAALALYPEQHTKIAVLVNNDFFTGPAIRTRVAKILFEP